MSPLTPTKQAQRALSLYHLYRCIIGLALVWMVSSQLLTGSNPLTLTLLSWGYLLVNGGLALGKKSLEPLGQLLLALMDVLWLLGLFYLTGGLSSGIGSLIVVAVAIANTLIQGRWGLFLAAAASIGLTYPAFYWGLDAPQNLANSQRVQAGTLGALCFIAAVLVQGLARRLQTSEQLTHQQARDVANLEALNAQVLQRLQTGILVLDPHQHIVLVNPLATAQLGPQIRVGANLNQVCPALADRITEWQLNPKRSSRPLSSPLGLPLQPSFCLLAPDTAQRHLLIFLEDLSAIAQQAQQLKLASLGRLTASIAHEIRNPLGAISHAAQLLGESEELSATDRRLSQIIQDQSCRVNRIIENVLQLSRRVPSQPQPLELVAWLRRVTQRLPANQERLSVVCTEKVLHTQADASQLEQVLDNLLRNARQHSPHAQVTLHLYRDTQTHLPTLDVLDDGVGISSEHQPHIFEPFFTTNIQGTGL